MALTFPISNGMKIRIKRFDKRLPLPKHDSKGAAAFDLAARETVTIAPHQVSFVFLNTVIETPANHFLLLAARSSLHKRGLIVANGIGIVDPDYSGNEDELKSPLYNFTDQPVTIEKGDRIIQGVFIKKAEYEWNEVSKMPNKIRGGFGTTGHK